VPDRKEQEDHVGLFEEYPLLLIPIIIITMEAWTLVKTVVRDHVERRRALRA